MDDLSRSEKAYVIAALFLCKLGIDKLFFVKSYSNS